MYIFILFIALPTYWCIANRKLINEFINLLREEN